MNERSGGMSRQAWEDMFPHLVIKGKAAPPSQGQARVNPAEPTYYRTEAAGDVEIPYDPGMPGGEQVSRERFYEIHPELRPAQIDIDAVNTAGKEQIYKDTYGQVFINKVSQGYNEQVADRLAHEAGQIAQRGYVSTEPVGPQSEVMAAVVDDALKRQALEQIAQASAQGNINLAGLRHAPAAAKAPYTEPMVTITNAMEAAPAPVTPSGQRMAMRYPAGILAALLGGGGLWELIDADPRRETAEV